MRQGRQASVQCVAASICPVLSSLDPFLSGLPGRSEGPPVTDDPEGHEKVTERFGRLGPIIREVGLRRARPHSAGRPCASFIRFQRLERALLVASVWAKKGRIALYANVMNLVFTVCGRSYRSQFNLAKRM